jgi:arylsulfatase A-like enzyme
VESIAPEQVENCRVSTPPAWKGVPVIKQPRNTHEPYIFEGPEHLSHSAFVADEMCTFLNQQKRNQPFFAIAGFYAPHAPLNPPARFVDMYDANEMPLPHLDNEKSVVPWTGLNLEDDHWRVIKAYYYALITHVDDQIGRILKCLEKNNLAEDTIVVFTSDHGEHLGDHGLIQKGPPGMISCTHVPLMLCCPTLFGHQNIPELIEAVDIAPTLLDFCGVQIPPFFQGRSFKSKIMKGPYTPRKSVYIEFKDPFRSSWKTIRTSQYTYSLFTPIYEENHQIELLFDLRNDPHEQKNVSDDTNYIEVLHNMRQELLSRWFDVEKQLPRRTGQY